MASTVYFKLAAIFVAVVIGYVAARMRWLGDARSGADPARTMSAAALYVFVPALLFRTTARLDFATLPWRTLIAFFVPVMLLMLAVYAFVRWRGGPAAQPSTRAIAVGFGNSVQVGIPVAAAVFGERGLALHVAIVSLHALVLLTLLTTLVELDLARERAREAGGSGLGAALALTVRNTVVHPVVLPVLAGLGWNATGLPLPGPVDESLLLLGSAVSPLCLVLIGMSLHAYGVRGQVGPALGLVALKLLALPALTLAVAYAGFGLRGMPLQVVVMMAALPAGSNALIFAQRYRSNEAEVTTAVVLGTFGFALAAPGWLAVLALLDG